MFRESLKPNNATSWDRFILKHNGSFLQSWAWGEFQKSLGRQLWRIEGGQIVRHTLAMGKSYLYSPRGPIGKISNFLSEMEKIKSGRDIFLRVEPETTITNYKLPITVKRLPWDIQPSRTIVLDITKTEDEILASMHPKHRYNIRLAERKGVKIRISELVQDFENFWKLMQETAKRGKFYTHPKDHYEKLLAVKDENLKILLFLAEYKGKIVAANIVNFFGEKAVYMHGASSPGYRALMSPHLLQWEQIKEAKKRNCQEYDFWGIDEQKWPGVTRFKRGFGGREVQHPGTLDLVFNKLWYGIYRLARRIS